MNKSKIKLVGNAIMGLLMVLDYAIVPIGANASVLPRRVEYAEETRYSAPVRDRKETETPEQPASFVVWEDAKAVNNAEQIDGMTYLGRYKITGYDTCAKCCGKSDGITASGTQATVGRTCAAPKGIPFGTVLYIDGIGERIVEDRGGFAENVIDVLCENHPDCYAITGYYDVYVVEQ